MLQITRVISFFRGISHENHQNGSVPWCYKWQISSTFFMVVPMKFIKTAQYHDATNNTRHLIFLQVFPWKSPKRLSTVMLQIADFFCMFHGISHEIHQISSVPWCRKDKNLYWSSFSAGKPRCLSSKPSQWGVFSQGPAWLPSDSQGPCASWPEDPAARAPVCSVPVGLPEDADPVPGAPLVASPPSGSCDNFSWYFLWFSQKQLRDPQRTLH